MWSRWLPTATPTPIPFIGLDVQIISLTTSAGQITRRFRRYNGENSPLPITPYDLWLALGYGENPPGPRAPAEGIAPFDLLSGQAADLMLVWLGAASRSGHWGSGHGS